MLINNISDAKSHLSELIEKVLRGEEVIIAKAGKPVVRLVPYVKDNSPRIPGRLKGKIKIAEDFDITPDQIIKDFEGDIS
jgi:prevent-host-death family protein